MLAAQLALILASAFAGAAVYVGSVEHAARAHLDDRSALIEWKPAYQRGFAMQGPLALGATALGLAAFWQSGVWVWLVGAAVMIAPWPYTLLVIKPVNDRLMANDPAQAGPETRALLERWGHLHGGRTALGCLATAIYLVASLR